MKKPLQVTFVSHATLKISGTYGTLLCDPWFLNEPIYNFSTWKFPAACMDPQEVVENVDYLYITHSHEDHFHAPSLNLIPRDVQVLLPAYDSHPSLRAQTIELVLREFGFYNIRKLHDWETIKLDETTEFTCIPSAKSRRHDWENSGFYLRHHDISLLNMNDNVSDEALCHEINQHCGHVDIGFIQAGGVSMYPGCFKMDRQKMVEEAQKRKLAFRDQRRMLDIIKPDYIVPFAADFCWLDPKYFHNNWANRTTPALFKQMLETDYANSHTQLVQMYPSDMWSKSTGLIRNHHEVDWDNYLIEIEELQARFQPKIDSISAWLSESPTHNLKERTQAHTARVEKWITRDYIDFSARFRLQIEGTQEKFSFVIKANPNDKFVVDWNDNGPVDSTLHVPEVIWASILDARLNWNMIQWVSQAEQGEFRPDMTHFWFWLESHVALNTQNIQCVLDKRLYPHLKELVRPTLGTDLPTNETV
jgi:L-ascorbate metabolism protein UlaG (beta-lactamase superfamily)